MGNHDNNMQRKMVVEYQEDYEAWLKEQGSVAQNLVQ